MVRVLVVDSFEGNNFGLVILIMVIGRVVRTEIFSFSVPAPGKFWLRLWLLESNPEIVSWVLNF